MQNIKTITPNKSELKDYTPAIKIGNDYLVGGIGGNFLPGGVISGTDISDTTATAADMLAGKVFYTSDGVRTSGVIPSMVASTYTPTTSSIVIPGGNYLSASQTILGDSNLIADNIAMDVTIFGVTGTHQGGGGGGGVVDVVKVTQYVPYSPQKTAINSITVSGITYISVWDGDVEDYVEKDYSAMNGSYVVTASTQYAELKDKIYKHATQNYYLYFYDNGWDEEHEWYCLLTDSTEHELYGALLNIYIDGSTPAIPSGNNTWNNYESGDERSVNTNPIETITPEVQQVLKGVKATSYNAGTWTFRSTVEDLTKGATEPSVDFLFNAKNNVIIGNSFSHTNLPVNGLVLYDSFVGATPEIGSAPYDSGGDIIRNTTFRGVTGVHYDGGSYQSYQLTNGISSSWTLCLWSWCDTQEQTRLLCSYGIGEDPSSVWGAERVNYWDGYLWLSSNGCKLDNPWEKWWCILLGYDSTLNKEWSECYQGTNLIGMGSVSGDSSLERFCLGKIIKEGSNEFSGYIGPIRVYNRTLNYDEKQALIREFTPTNA